jgi:predicted dehydrogenase
MLFREELVFEAESEAEADAIAQHITRLLRGRPELACRLVDFSPHSPEPAPLLPEMPRRTLAMPRRDPSVQARASSIAPRSPFDGEQENHLFLVGAGAYAVVFVLPLLNRLRFDTLIEYNPLRASVIGRKFGFRQVETDYRRVLDRASSLGRITVVVANYHSHHADTAIQFMEANSRACVMIEKPSVIGYEQFERLLPYVKDKTRFVEIGFNRRYTSMIRRTKRLLEGRRSPLTLTCIISEDAMEPAHWYFWATEGTRVYGNLCHWIDLGVHLVGSRPVEIAAMADRDFQAASNVSIRFEDGSLVNLVCGERGDGLRGVQEYIDLRTDQLTVQIHDFRRMVVLQDGRRHVYRSLTRDKGHTEMYRVLSHAVLNLLRPQYTSADFVRTAVLTEEIHRMLGSGRRHNDIDMSTLERWEGEPLS